jgi:hypothetical protein
MILNTVNLGLRFRWTVKQPTIQAYFALFFSHLHCICTNISYILTSNKASRNDH